MIRLAGGHALLLAAIITASSAHAVSQESSQALSPEDQQALNAMVDMVKDTIMGQKNFAAKTLESCLLAFGHKQFCECLSQELPITQTFDSYIFFVTADKESLNYSQLGAEDKSLIDNATHARDTCVRQLGKH